MDNYSNLKKVIDELKENNEIETFNEEATKLSIIVRILSKLGWNQYDNREVTPEYQLGELRVDYSLRDSGNNLIFIEVKRPSEELEKHKEQLLKYAFREGIELAILTNGKEWWFYLPMKKGSWDQRRFYVINIKNQETDKLCKHFFDFLSKEKVITGEALVNAKKFHSSRKREAILDETIPEVWAQIIETSDERLLELIAETTESICGIRPSLERVETFFLKQREFQFYNQPKHGEKNLNRKIEKTTKTGTFDNYTGSIVSSFKFLGENYPVRTWKEVLKNLANVIYHNHRREFHRALELRGKKRPYFTDREFELRLPYRIKNSHFFVETNLNSNLIVKICHQLIAIFGYSKTDLSFQILNQRY